MNILFPMSGKKLLLRDKKEPYPTALIEINGETIIEKVIDNYSTIASLNTFIFLVSEEDCQKHHIDAVISRTTTLPTKIIPIRGQTQGAACTALMAIESINNDQPLIIANSDQVITTDLNLILEAFQEKVSDCGVITFKTIHPRWSFILTDNSGSIIEVAEKNPISNQGIAGFYYFKQGSYFVDAAMDMIFKEAHVNGNYYIAPAINELILKGKKVHHKAIDASEFHTLYSEDKIHEYKLLMQTQKAEVEESLARR